MFAEESRVLNAFVVSKYNISQIKYRKTTMKKNNLHFNGRKGVM